MEEEIAQLVALAGNKNRYQYFIAFLCFLFWVNLTVLAFSLGFLENKPLISYYDAEKNETTVESMEYDHCDWDKSNYTIVETYKFSWVINLGLECEKLKVSLIGTFTSIGALLGAILYSSFTKRFGAKKVILVSTAIFICAVEASVSTRLYTNFPSPCSAMDRNVASIREDGTRYLYLAKSSRNESTSSLSRC